MNHLTVRVSVGLRDTDGVRLDAMLLDIGAVIIRELPRKAAPAGYVDLLVEDTSAPADVRGQTVTPIFAEHDDGAGLVLSFDRWKVWAAPEAIEA